MGTAVGMRSDYSVGALRRLAKASKDANQSRRLLSLAGIADGMSREDAARIGGMDRQTLRDWVHRFNAQGPEGLKDVRGPGPKPFSHISARPRHPAQDAETIQAFKKTSLPR